MTHNFKPGDVAMTQFGRSVVFSGKGCGHYDSGHYDSAPHWHHVTNGGWDPLDSHPDARPLVVIDPEDRDLVERLIEAIDARVHTDCESGTCRIDQTQAALREFANPKPPKPEEPTGLGAVVEDDKGLRWLRDHDGFWVSDDGALKYAAVPAVRVLSEGVQP